MSERILGIIYICIILMLGGCTSFACFWGGCPEKNRLHEAIREVGYVPIEMPSTAYRPGAVVHIGKRDPFQASLVCPYGSYIGKPKVSTDEAISIEASKRLSNSLSLGADFIRQVNADLGASYVKDIKVALTNVSVEEIPDNLVHKGLSSQSQDCTQAIHNQDRADLGFLQSALKADATYEISFDEKTDVAIGAKQELLGRLAVKLEGKQVAGDTYRIRGSKLYWGVKEPRGDLLLTPIRIGELQLLDEKNAVKTGDDYVVSKLQPRSSTDFHYRNPDDLVVAILFTVQDFVKRASDIDVDTTISIKDSAGRKLAKASVPRFSNIHAWEHMSNVRQIGVEEVKKYLSLPTDSMAYIAVISDFELGDIPDGEGYVEISVTDNASKASDRKLLPIRVNRE